MEGSVLGISQLVPYQNQLPIDSMGTVDSRQKTPPIQHLTQRFNNRMSLE